ncbi:uncharacterized protein TrAtP1_005077 [Trichoderma atroviride]|uniref:uncharacterized protein n=1 Tax=Hypocrea atroviridis TaxID=63577 RepID=UPI00331A125E|nr:hypothetical protein TrAtP1_005077 [Trichoderma atroviride]
MRHNQDQMAADQSQLAHGSGNGNSLRPRRPPALYAPQPPSASKARFHRQRLAEQRLVVWPGGPAAQQRTVTAQHRASGLNPLKELTCAQQPPRALAASVGASKLSCPP